jgi:hypothetical protein
MGTASLYLRVHLNKVTVRMDSGVYSHLTVPHLQILLRRLYRTNSVTDRLHSAVILEKLVNSQLIKKFPAQYPRRAKTKSKVSLQSSQQPATGPCAEADKSSSRPPSILLKIHFNIILPSNPSSHKRSLYLGLYEQNYSITPKAYSRRN